MNTFMASIKPRNSCQEYIDVVDLCQKRNKALGRCKGGLVEGLGGGRERAVGKQLTSLHN